MYLCCLSTAHFYPLTGNGTTANIGLKILGTAGSLSMSMEPAEDGEETVTRGSRRRFLMEKRLGKVKTMEVWQDCTGSYPSW